VNRLLLALTWLYQNMAVVITITLDIGIRANDGICSMCWVCWNGMAASWKGIATYRYDDNMI